MAVLVMSESRGGKSKGRSEYTWYGRIVFGLMADRDIRNPTELFRRIEALGGYPRRLSEATTNNILKGKQGAPFEFHQYTTVVLDQVRALTAEEREELEDAFAWGQRHVSDAGYNRENVERAYDFVAEMRRKQEEDGDDQTEGI
jgi:hypothetical protein